MKADILMPIRIRSIFWKAHFQSVFGFLQIVGTSIPGLFLIYTISTITYCQFHRDRFGSGIAGAAKEKIVRLKKKLSKPMKRIFLYKRIFERYWRQLLIFSRKFFIGRFKASTKQYNQLRKWFRNMTAGFDIAQLILNIYSVASLFIIAMVVSDGILSIETTLPY